MIWPKEITLVSRTQPSGPLCFWQCFNSSLLCITNTVCEETFCIRPVVAPFSDLVNFCHFGHWSIFFKDNLHHYHHQYYLLDHLDHLRLAELRKWIVLIATPNNSHSVWPAESYSCRSVPSVKQQSQIMELNVHCAVFKWWALVCTFVHKWNTTDHSSQVDRGCIYEDLGRLHSPSQRFKLWCATTAWLLSSSLVQWGKNRQLALREKQKPSNL